MASPNMQFGKMAGSVLYQRFGISKNFCTLAERKAFLTATSPSCWTLCDSFELSRPKIG